MLLKFKHDTGLETRGVHGLQILSGQLRYCDSLRISCPPVDIRNRYVRGLSCTRYWYLDSWTVQLIIKLCWFLEATDLKTEWRGSRTRYYIFCVEDISFFSVIRAPSCYCLWHSSYCCTQGIIGNILIVFKVDIPLRFRIFNYIENFVNWDLSVCWKQCKLPLRFDTVF